MGRWFNHDLVQKIYWKHQSAITQFSLDRSVGDLGHHLVFNRPAACISDLLRLVVEPEFAFTLLGTIFLGLVALDVLVCILARVPLRLFPYVPLYTLMQTLVMRPVRIAALVGELIFVYSRRDNYIPEQQRWRLP